MKHLDKRRLDILIESEVANQLTQEQIFWLDRCCNKRAKPPARGTWKYENGVVNVDGNFNIELGTFSSFPVKFGIVTGDFWCNANSFTSLKDCPIEVGGDFACNHNKLTSLEYMPIKVGGDFFCYNNPFILNDKLFIALAKIGRRKIHHIATLFQQLKDQIPIQFGITDQAIIDEIWGSYINNIFNGEK